MITEYLKNLEKIGQVMTFLKKYDKKTNCKRAKRKKNGAFVFSPNTTK